MCARFCTSLCEIESCRHVFTKCGPYLVQVPYNSLSQHGGPHVHDYTYNVSFSINTDGIPVFKSSKMALWPIFLMINELPFKQRKLPENMLQAGLWFGPTLCAQQG